MRHQSVSLIVPCYNEEANIQKGVLDKIGNFTKQNKRIKEVIIVDDGSGDRSREIIRTVYLPRFSHFILLENDHGGKAQAVLSGIKKAGGDLIMFSDIDLATPIEEAEKLIDAAKEYDIVIGSRKSARQGAPITRKILSFGMMFVRGVIIGLKGVQDTQCGFKLFRRDVANRIIGKLQVFKRKKKLKGSSVSAGFDLEFLYVGSRMGYSIREIPVVWRHVETKNVNFVKDAIESIHDILLLKWYDLTGAYGDNE